MDFITWLIALPTAIILFFFPVPQEAIQAPEIASTTPQAEIIVIDAISTPTVKERVIDALQKEDIQVREIPVIIPPIVIPQVPFPVGGEIITPMPEPEPVVEVPVPVTLSVARIDLNSKPFGGNCSQLRFTAKVNKTSTIVFINPETKDEVRQVASNETTFIYYPQHSKEKQVLMFYVDGTPDIRSEIELDIVGTIKDELPADKLTDQGEYWQTENGEKVSKTTGLCL